MSYTEVPTIQQNPQDVSPKRRWGLKVRLGQEPQLDAEDPEQVDSDGGPRRSTRMGKKPIPFTSEDFGKKENRDRPKRHSGKNLKKRSSTNNGTVKQNRERGSTASKDDSIEIVSEVVAPIFLKKKHHDEARAVKKAKQEFLFSGVPETLKQQTTAIQVLEQRPVEIFPTVSHVTQAGSRPWRLPYPEHLGTLMRHRVLQVPHQPTSFSCLKATHPPTTDPPTPDACPTPQASCMDWRFCKDWITRLKADHSLSYPFFRTLRSLLPKSKRGGEALWTDTYAPTASADILSNRKPVQQLKSWLTAWKLKAGDTIAPVSVSKKTNKKVAKRKRVDSDGTEDDYLVDEKSNSSWNSEEQLCNCVLLVGPSGCGKTATVYALAEELGYNVLEVNASSRRNGKTVLSHLHEATQSHSLNNNPSASSSMSKLFFGSCKAEKPTVKPEEPKPTLSLVLFEDVDIVFESEDESFYSALTTLIQTSKRPVILTLGSTEERALVAVQEKIKSFFDVLLFENPDWPAACGYLWSLCLAEGYPMEWNSLKRWLGQRSRDGVDLRSLLLDLEFTMDHHPLRLKLNFSQLQLANEEVPSTEKRRLSDGLKECPAAPIQFIQLPECQKFKEPVYATDANPPRFTYDPDEDLITANNSAKQTFSRALMNDDLFDDSQSHQEPSPNDDDPPIALQPSEWKGDLTPLGRSLDFRAAQDLFHSCRSTVKLSWHDSAVMLDIEQCLMQQSTKLMEKELSEAPRLATEMEMSKTKDELSIQDSTQTLLRSCISKNALLQRSSHSTDYLPFLRSSLRCDLEKSLVKRRRKPRCREPSSIRLPSIDLVLSTPVVIQLANTF